MRVERIGGATLYLGDCLDAMARLPDASADMVLCDLPYGTTNNKWDSVIPFAALWEAYERIAKPSAAIVLTAQPPFDKVLGASRLPLFRYEWIWRKTKPTGFLNAQRQPLKEHENVLVFYSRQPTYNPQGTTAVLINSGRANKAGAGNYGKVASREYTQTVGNFPRSVLNFQHEPNPVHPTQKPVALFEYLIRTYTNPGDTVLDNCIGSGTTAVAALNAGRKCVGIEREQHYFDTACKRIAAAIAQPSLLEAAA